jgi:hypothetical protein
MGTGLATDQNVEDLARVLMSEASVGNQTERLSVGWTVRNRMSRNGTTSVADVYRAYSRNQAPTDAMRATARQILAADAATDPTNGATHYYSPRGMPAEGQNTTGFDVAGGLETTSGLNAQHYRPGFATTYEARDVTGVRPAYYRFFRSTQTGHVR